MLFLSLKKGDELDINNYLSISLLTCFTKIFEKVIFNRISNFFNKHSVQEANQYRFRAGCSISHTILDILLQFMIVLTIINIQEWLHLLLLKLLIQYTTKDF